MLVARSLAVLILINVLHYEVHGANNKNGLNIQDFIDQMFQITRFLPPDFNALAEPFILEYLNSAMTDALGGDVKAVHYTDGSNGQVTCATDLDCNFDMPCRWKVDTRTDLRFYQGVGHPEQKVFAVLTEMPEPMDPPFIIGAGNEGSHAAWLVSDPVPNQPGDGVITFKLWLTPLVWVKVCTRNVGDTNFTFCTEPFEPSTGGYTATKAAKIPGPINTPFEIVFEATNFIVSPGGLAFIDDITYRSDTCGAGPPVMPHPTPAPTGLPSVDTTLVSLSSTGQRRTTSLSSISSRSKMVNRSFNSNRSQVSTASTGRLRTAPPANSASSESSFVLTVSSEHLKPSSSASLTPSSSQSTAPAVTANHQQSSANGENEKVTSNVADTDNTICRNVRCGFNRGDTCHYTLDISPEGAMFRLQTGPFGKIINDASLGKSSQGGYIVADASEEAVNPGTLFQMESGLFSLNYPIDLQFYRWQNRSGAQLTICLNTNANCIKTFNEATTNGWTLSTVRISPADTRSHELNRVIIVVEGLAKDDFVAIDELSVPSAECEL